MRTRTVDTDLGEDLIGNEAVALLDFRRCTWFEASERVAWKGEDGKLIGGVALMDAFEVAHHLSKPRSAGRRDDDETHLVLEALEVDELEVEVLSEELVEGHGLTGGDLARSQRCISR